MKVSKLYEVINIDELEGRAADNSYWNTSLNFVKSVWDKEIQQLSKKQVEWLERISESFS